MSSTKTNEAIVIAKTSGSDAIYSVAFQPDGIHLLSGSGDGVRRWRIADGQEVGNRMEMYSNNAISVSRDGKWVVCGTTRGATVWDAKTQEKVTEVEGTSYVGAVDISSDSTRFATGTGSISKKASIWDIITGERLVGPLQHNAYIAGIKFSPNDEHIATAVGDRSIHVFDSRDGDQLITIKTDIPPWSPTTPLAWSKNGQQCFATSSDNKIKSFDVSTGSQLAELQVQDYGDIVSIALAANGKFLATFADHSISFCDTSTFTQIGPVIKDSQRIRSIVLSPDCSYLATGGFNGNITIRNLSNILPDSYGPFNAPAQEEPESETPKDRSQQQNEQPSTSGVHDNQAPGSTQEQPTTSSPLVSEAHREDSDDDLLETELPSSTPAPLFNYDEPPSPASSDRPREVGVMPPRSLQATPLPGPSSVTSPPAAPSPKKPPDAPGSSKGTSVPERWLQTRFKKANKNQGSEPPDRLSTKSGRPVSLRFNSQSQPTANNAKKRFSTIAAGQRVRRAVAKPVNWRKRDTEAAKPGHAKKDASRSGQRSESAKEVDPAQEAKDTARPAVVTEVHVMPETGDATVSIAFKFKLPAWMLCLRASSTEDGKH